MAFLSQLMAALLSFLVLIQYAAALPTAVPTEADAQRTDDDV